LISFSQYVASGKIKLFSYNEIKALNADSINKLSPTMIKQIFTKLTINQKLLLKGQQLTELSIKQKDEVRILKKPESTGNTDILINAEKNNAKLKKIIDSINKPNQSAIEQALKQYNELKKLIEKNQINTNLKMKSNSIAILNTKLMSQFKITDSILNSVQSAAPAQVTPAQVTPAQVTPAQVTPVTSSITAMQPATTAPTVIATLSNPSTAQAISIAVTKPAATITSPEFIADSTIVSNIKDSTSFDVEFKKVFDDLANEDNTASIYSKMLDGKTDLFILDDSSKFNSFKQTLQTLLALQSKIELSSSQRKFSKLTKPDKYTLDDANGTETGFAESIVFRPSTIQAFQTESMIWLWYIILMFAQNAISWTDDSSKKVSISNAEKIIRSAITGENY
jgi:hypothetical protein